MPNPPLPDPAELGVIQSGVATFFGRPQATLDTLAGFRCAIAGVPATAFIDTGAEVSAVNSRLFAALIDLHPTHVNLGTLPLTGVTVANSSGA